MLPGDHHWQTPQTDALFDAILLLETRDEAARFFRDLCTLRELEEMAQRWAVVRLLDQGLHYSEISRQTGASTATITRINTWLQHGTGGYRLVLARMREREGRPAAEEATRRP
jgi:TrpR-related protein YerC/YecD